MRLPMARFLVGLIMIWLLLVLVLAVTVLLFTLSRRYNCVIVCVNVIFVILCSVMLVDFMICIGCYLLELFFGQDVFKL